jgi:hypothetical protein
VRQAGERKADEEEERVEEGEEEEGGGGGAKPRWSPVLKKSRASSLSSSSMSIHFA